ncbi:MAG: dipicolinate synthase subunit DpsA [Oscillospiraceae bacterium]|nr:dipicolinate synthase subunit DpsA [Oscillospiraceae bacterium]
MKKTFLAAGGDLRQIYAAKELADKYKVYLTGFDKTIIIPDNIISVEKPSDIPERVDFMLLPMPVSADAVLINAPYCKNTIPATQLTSVIKENGIVFGGKIDNNINTIFHKAGLEVYDYLEREEFSVANAVPTAEGAIQIAFEELATTIYGSEVLVTGFGRISRILIKMLHALGAHVTVSARKYADISWAEIYGCKTIHISALKEADKPYDIIFNTVPFLLFDEDSLAFVKKDCLLIDLASKPGGIDFDAAARAGLKVVWALGLPGKVAPVSSGIIIANTIENILAERGL